MLFEQGRRLARQRRQFRPSGEKRYAVSPCAPKPKLVTQITAAERKQTGQERIEGPMLRGEARK